MAGRINWRELAIMVGITALVAVLQALATFDPAEIQDWRAWAVGLGTAVVTRSSGAALAYITARWTRDGSIDTAG